MATKNNRQSKIERARSRVAKIKGYYRHIAIFIIINGFLLLSKKSIAIALFGEGNPVNSKAMSWVEWNLYIWLAILAIHTILVFGKAPLFMKKWEDRQIDKFIEEERKR